MDENNSRILVSKELEGQLPDIEESLSDYLFSTVCVYLKDSTFLLELDGPITTFSISDNVNLDLKVNLEKAFYIMKFKDKLMFDEVNFILKDSLLKLEGTYKIKKAKMTDIDINMQECNLKLNIKISA